MQGRPEKLTRWSMFSVLIALTPLFISYLAMRLDGGAPSLHLVTARGELLLISSTIGSGAVGELLPSGRNQAVFKVLAGGSCVFLILLCSMFFAALQDHQDPDPAAVFTTSVSLFGGTLLASLSAVYLSYGGEQQ